MKFEYKGREQSDFDARNEKKKQIAQKNAAKTRKLEKRKKILICFMAIFMFCVLLVALSSTFLFSINEIKVTGLTYLQPNQVLEASGVKVGDSLFTLRTDKVEQTIENTLTSVDEVKVSKSFPNTLNINIVESISTAQIYSGGSYVVVDKKGQVLSIEVVAADVPIICGITINLPVLGQKFTTGDASIDQDILYAYTTILSDPTYKINYLDLSDIYSITSICNDLFYIDYGSMINIDYKMTFLQKIITDNQPAGRPGKIDLSYLTGNNTQVYYNDISIEPEKNDMMIKCGVKQPEPPPVTSSTSSASQQSSSSGAISSSETDNSSQDSSSSDTDGSDSQNSSTNDTSEEGTNSTESELSGD